MSGGDVMSLSEADLLTFPKAWLERQCDELKIQHKPRDTKSVLASAIVAHRSAALAARSSSPANVFQNDRAISPPTSINMPPPQNAKGGRNGVAATPRVTQAVRVAPATVAVTTNRGRSPARAGARERSSSVSRGSAVPVAVRVQLAPAPAPVQVDDDVSAQFDDVPHDRSPSPAPRRASASPAAVVVAAPRSKSPVRFTRNDVGGGVDFVAAEERAAHRRMIAMVAGGVVAVLVLIAAALLRSPTSPGEVAAIAAYQRLREARGAFLCDPSVPYTFKSIDLFGDLNGSDLQEAILSLTKCNGVDEDEVGSAVVFSVDPAFATPTLGCRLSLFASDNWPLLVGVAAILVAALALVLRAQQAKWRQRRTQELVAEVFAMLKAQAVAFDRDETKQSFIAVVHLRDSLLPHDGDTKLWDDVLAIVQRNTCVKTSGHLVGGAQCDVLEWVAPLVIDQPAFRSPQRVASPRAPEPTSVASPYVPASAHRHASYPIL